MDIKEKLYTIGSKAYSSLTNTEVAPYKKDGAPKKENPATSSVDHSDTEKPTDEAKKKKKNGAILLGIGAVAVVAILGLLFGSGSSDRRPQINMADYVTVSMASNSRNGHGRVILSIDEDALKATMKETFHKAITPYEIAETVKATTLTAIPSEGLSNGDVVTIDVTVDQTWTDMYFSSAANFAGGTGTYTVAGLSDAEVIDPFDSSLIEVSWSGNSGAATVSLNVKSSAPYIPFLNYSVKPNKGLSNGDVVVVNIDPNTQRLTEMGYAIADLENWYVEFTVSGLDELVVDPADIPAAVINSMVSYAESDLADNFSALQLDELDQVVTEPEITSIYYFDKVNKAEPYTNYFRSLEMTNGIFVLGHFFVQDVEMETPDGTETAEPTVVGNFGGYYVWIFPNVVKETNGTYSYDKNMITRWPTQLQTESDCINWAKGEFTDFSVVNVGTNS